MLTQGQALLGFRPPDAHLQDLQMAQCCWLVSNLAPLLPFACPLASFWHIPHPPPTHSRPAYHLRVFLAHVETHEQGPYNHHNHQHHHHNHDKQALEGQWAAGDAKPAPRGC